MGHVDSGASTHIFKAASKDETNNGAKYGFTVNPDQLSELSVDLVEEGKTFYKAITKYKRAFFSELENEVKMQIPINNFRYTWWTRYGSKSGNSSCK